MVKWVVGGESVKVSYWKGSCSCCQCSWSMLKCGSVLQLLFMRSLELGVEQQDKSPRSCGTISFWLVQHNGPWEVVGVSVDSWLVLVLAKNGVSFLHDSSSLLSSLNSSPHFRSFLVKVIQTHSIQTYHRYMYVLYFVLSQSHNKIRCWCDQTSRSIEEYYCNHGSTKVSTKNLG